MAEDKPLPPFFGVKVSPKRLHLDRYQRANSFFLLLLLPFLSSFFFLLRLPFFFYLLCFSFVFWSIFSNIVRLFLCFFLILILLDLLLSGKGIEGAQRPDKESDN